MSLAKSALASTVNQILLLNDDLDTSQVFLRESQKFSNFTNYKLWLRSDVLDLLKSEFGEDVLAAFNSIKPMAYKADLARYCIAYVNGGWYFDLNMELAGLDSLQAFNDDFEALVFRDVPGARVIASVCNSVFWFREPGHPALLDLIKASVKNILNKEYSTHPHGITGPLVFGECLVNYQKTNPTSNLLVGDTLMIENKPSHVFNEVTPGSFSIFSQRRAMDSSIVDVMPKSYEATSDYWQMYIEKRVY